MQVPQRFAATAGLKLRDFDEGALVFHPGSWDAHVLNPAAAAVLLRCLDTPQDEATTASLLLELLEPRERERAAEHARRVLSDLAELDLILPLRDGCD